MRRVHVIALLAIVIALVGTAAIVRRATSDEALPAVSIEVTQTATATPSPTTPSATPTITTTPTPAPARSEAERYRAAILSRDEGDLETAAAELRNVAELDGVLAPFARFRLAQVLVAYGEYDEAVEAYELAVSDPALPNVLRPIGRREAAAALGELGRFEEAIELFGVVINDLSSSPLQRSAAHWERAQLLLAADDAGWADDALALIAQSPGDPAAALALDALEEAEITVPALSAAYTRYLARENDLATVRYEQIIGGGPNAATAAVAWFYLGALAERVPDRAGAIAAYSESLRLDAAGTRADDAAYWRARVAEEDGDFEAAATFYRVLVDEYPFSRFAGDSTLRSALVIFEASDEPQALEILETIATSGGAEAAAAARWYGLVAGEDARIEAGVPTASEIDARSLSAILTAAGSASLDAPTIEPVPRQVENSTVVDQWMIASYGVPTATDRLNPLIFNEIAPSLVDTGERSLARAVVLEELDAVAADPHAVLELAGRASELGLPDVALIAAMRLLGPMSTEGRLETPADVERFAYPAPWADLLLAASEEFEVPPLLLLALIRQESAFEPDVVSPAGAIGLTQVIPPTGVQIAAVLDESWGGATSLTEPETSLRYGAAYLATQLEAFDGNMFAALAAYNAGPTNARRWLENQVWAGADGYVQTIDFEETRRYVSSVIEQYAWYRFVYGLADTPMIR